MIVKEKPTFANYYENNIAGASCHRGVTTIGFHTLANHVVTEMVWLGVHAYSAALCVIFIQLASLSAKNMLFIAAGIVQYSYSL